MHTSSKELLLRTEAQDRKARPHLTVIIRGTSCGDRGMRAETSYEVKTTYACCLVVQPKGEEDVESEAVEEDDTLEQVRLRVASWHTGVTCTALTQRRGLFEKPRQQALGSHAPAC